MENLKVKVKNKVESKEVQELFFGLGCDFYFGGKTHCNTHLGLVTANKDGLMANIELDGFEYKEITIQQLRDMVVLKRNDVNDRNVIDPEYTANLYLDSKGELFVFHVPTQSWKISNLNSEEEVMQRLIQIKKKEMNEFLVNHDNKWTLQLLDSDTEENSYRVAVPSGAEVLTECLDDGEIFKLWWNGRSKINVGYDSNWNLIDRRVNDFLMEYPNAEIVWQRSETESLNDQYAEIEKIRQDTVKVTIDELKHRVGIDATLAERQATYGCFEDVAFVTENVMGVLSKARPNGLSDLPHTHRMALYMIASKMARIVNGDFNHLDGWHDIGGYAKLIENLIGDEDE